ncbi:LysE family transporter [Pantoea agglomerans]|uniref:LysE family transporter n=1 Tax=Enterobacter agglomerans TaxID=549 RepID=UPI001F3B07B6|nr:LysE family transporter [Pantoea agglomerans]
MVANLRNPKLSLFFLAFLPKFIATRDVNPTQSMLILSVFFAVMTFVVFCLYGVFASAVSHCVLGNRGLMRFLSISMLAIVWTSWWASRHCDCV